MEPIKITGLSSASSSKKCTLQFWMFAYSYSPNGFGGITFDWKGHNRIKLYGCSDYSCNFKCYQKDGSGPTLEIKDIKINQWVFLSCAVDYDKKIMYLNATTQDNINLYKAHTEVINAIPSPTSELTISDDSSYDEWGILFFRQIRLWKNAFFNPEFLSRVLIETPSKFPDLLHSWEPVYNGKMVDAYAQNNLKVVDIVDSSKEFTVYYGPSNKLFRTSYIKNAIKRFNLNEIHETIDYYYNNIFTFITESSHHKYKHIDSVHLFINEIDCDKIKFNDFISLENKKINETIFYINFIFDNSKNTYESKESVLKEFFSYMSIIYNKFTKISESSLMLLNKFISSKYISKTNKILLKFYYKSLIS
jgi:hypothetical protein